MAEQPGDDAQALATADRYRRERVPEIVNARAGDAGLIVRDPRRPSSRRTYVRAGGARSQAAPLRHVWPARPSLARGSASSRPALDPASLPTDENQIALFVDPTPAELGDSGEVRKISGQLEPLTTRGFAHAPHTGGLKVMVMSRQPSYLST